MINNLGYPIDIVNANITDLLQMKILTSNFGHTSAVEPRIAERQIISLCESKYAQLLLNKIATSLRYFQTFAYVTPLNTDHLNLIFLPEQIFSGIKELTDRVKNASALFKQLRDDMINQIEFINLKNEDANIKLFNAINFGLLINKIRIGIIDDLNNLDKLNYTNLIVLLEEWEKWFPELNIEINNNRIEII